MPYDVTYMWNLKYDISERETENRNGLTDRENRPVAAKGHASRGGTEGDFGISRCKLFCREWMSNKDLEQSTGNSSVSSNKLYWERRR